MTDEMREIYVAASLSDRFWDTTTPTALWRAQKRTDFDAGEMALQPHPGSETRLSDVKVVERDNQLGLTQKNKINLIL